MTTEKQNQNLGKGTIELSLIVRDSQGNPTNKRRTIVSDKGIDIYEFYMRYRGKPKRKTNKKQLKNKKGEKLPNQQEAEKILRELNKESE